MLVVPINLQLDDECLYQHTLAADQIAAGEIMQLVEGSACVAVETTQGRCCGLACALTLPVLCKSSAPDVVLVVTAVMVAMEVEIGDCLSD